MNCHYREATCHFCGKVGHLKSVCYSRKKTEAGQKKETPRPVLTVLVLEEDSDECPLYTLQSPSSTPPIKVSITLEGSPVEMELDTGAVYS